MFLGKEVRELNVMGEFTFPEFRRRISSSDGWNSKGQSVCEASALGEVNQVIEKLGGVKTVEQSFCNQEISQQNKYSLNYTLFTLYNYRVYICL